MEDKVQKQRFELKYRINEAKAQQMRYFVEDYLHCDTYGKTRPNRSYPVHSLYLDSRNLKTYQDTINGDRNRFKLRVRYYESEDTPVYFEVKRRYDKVIRKRRAKVHRHAVKSLLLGELPSYEHLVNKTPDQLDALNYFSYLQNQLHATPKMHVTYFREAYELEDSNAVRVTFDRFVKSTPHVSYDLKVDMPRYMPVFGDIVILELKFTNRFPSWLQELTQRFHTWQQSAAKYVDSVENLKFKRIEMA